MKDLTAFVPTTPSADGSFSYSAHGFLAAFCLLSQPARTKTATTTTHPPTHLSLFLLGPRLLGCLLLLQALSQLEAALDLLFEEEAVGRWVGGWARVGLGMTAGGFCSPSLSS